MGRRNGRYCVKCKTDCSPEEFVYARSERKKIGARLGWCVTCVEAGERERRVELRRAAMRPVSTLRDRLARFRARKERAKFIARGAPAIERTYIISLIGVHAKRGLTRVRISA